MITVLFAVLQPWARTCVKALTLAAIVCALTTSIGQAQRQKPASRVDTKEIPPAITTPDKVDTRLGTLEFKDGAPSKITVNKVYDQLDLMHASEAFLNAFRGASLVAGRKGLITAGVDDNAVIIFSDLMDSNSLFLTTNADTIYYLSFLDLTNGPLVVETPPLALGTFDDMWFRWIVDFGLPGPDRGAGGIQFRRTTSLTSR
jgi:hypothetical protein